MRRTPLAALALVAGAVSAMVLPGSTAQASVATVINGTPHPPYSAAAVYFETTESGCTGTLLLPNLLATAAHCMFNADGLPTQPGDLTFWAPGADTSTTPVSATRATSIMLNPAYVANRGEQESIDIAYVVLDTPLGTPFISRVATQSEVAALAAETAVLSQVGYGLTTPRDDPSGQLSSIPIGMSAAIDSSYAGGAKPLAIGTNGVTGTCAGDSGSPWIVQRGNEVLLVGLTSSGDNPPCEPAADGGSHDYLVVVAGQGDLLAQAQTAAGAVPAPTVRTCLKARGSQARCADGATWTYDFCWAAPRYRVEQETAGSWTRIHSGTAVKSSQCRRKYPYRIVATGEAVPGTTRMRIVIPRQPGVGRVSYDPFTITSG